MRPIAHGGRRGGWGPAHPASGEAISPFRQRFDRKGLPVGARGRADSRGGTRWRGEGATLSPRRGCPRSPSASQVARVYQHLSGGHKLAENFPTRVVRQSDARSHLSRVRRAPAGAVRLRLAALPAQLASASTRTAVRVLCLGIKRSYLWVRTHLCASRMGHVDNSGQRTRLRPFEEVEMASEAAVDDRGRLSRCLEGPPRGPSEPGRPSVYTAAATGRSALFP